LESGQDLAGFMTPLRWDTATEAGGPGEPSYDAQATAAHRVDPLGRPAPFEPGAGRGRFTVPAELLEPPPREDIPGIDRDEAAVVVDGYLYGLSQKEAICRLRVGRLAACLRQTRAYHRLGFSRLADYAVERLGISGRELQCAAQVWQQVEEIPALAEAYAAGRLNWTKLRMISAVVTPQSVEQWVTTAERCVSRELEQAIRSARGEGTSAGATAVQTMGAGAEDPDRVDGEPCARIRIRCPTRIRSLWRTVFELASRSSGGVLAAWQALELVAAEAMSNVDPQSLDGSRSGIDAIGTGVQAYTLHAADGETETCRVAPDACSHSACPHDTCPRDDCPHKVCPRDACPHNVCPRDACPHSTCFRDDNAPVSSASHADPDPTELTDLRELRGLLRSSPVAFDRDIEADPGVLRDLSPAELDAELLDTLRDMQGIDWQMGCLLRTFVDLRLHRHVGFSTMAEYVTERLGISVRKARDLARLERDRSAERAELAEAYRSGRISWVRALIVLPILSEKHAAAWIDRACLVTVRRLAEEVTWAADLRDRTGHAIGMAPPPLGATLERSDAEVIRQMRSRFDPETTERILHAAATMEVSLTFSGPVSVMAFVQDVLSAYRQPLEAPWRAFERMLVHAKEIWEAVPSHRNPIHDRDGWRCRVPACGSRRNLQEHHLLFRSQGGDNARSNRVSICAWHHLRGIHDGIVRAHGDATGEVRWQLGLGAGLSRGAFLSFCNDVYSEVANT
jgi:hypothetical protein